MCVQVLKLFSSVLFHLLLLLLKYQHKPPSSFHRPESLPLYSESDEALLPLLSSLSRKSPVALATSRTPGSGAAGCPLLEYGAQAASGLQSARMSLIRKEEVTVRDWAGPESCPGCRWGSSPGPEAPPGLGAPASRQSRAGEEAGEEQALLLSDRDRGLSSRGDERQPPSKGSPLGRAGLPARWERMESIAKPLAPSIAFCHDPPAASAAPRP